MPRAERRRLPETAREGARAVYFPSCLSRTMGSHPADSSELSLPEAFVRVAARAGVPVFLPEEVRGVCCGVPFSSKGYREAHAIAANRAIERFWHWSDEGRLPVVVDTSPCTWGVATCRTALTPENQSRFDRLTIQDAVAFTHDQLLPRLTLHQKAGRIALHPVCSLTKLGLGAKFEGIARFLSPDVFVPPSAGCCAFAGDRGFLLPELTAAATRLEAEEVRLARAEEHLGSSRTCEIGMTRATGEIYRSYLFLLEELTRP